MRELTRGMAQSKSWNWSENGSELTTLDTSLVTDLISANMINNTMEGLYRIGNNNKITPGIATHTVISKDKNDMLTLRKDAKWSNGDPVTAQDFAAGGEPSIPRPLRNMLIFILVSRMPTKITNGKAVPIAEELKLTVNTS